MGKIVLVPERLRAVREQLGISSAEAARKTGIDKSIYWRYEQGVISASDTAIRILAMYLGTSVSYLTGETDDMTPDVIPVSYSTYRRLQAYADKFVGLKTEQQDLLLGIIDEMQR